MNDLDKNCVVLFSNLHFFHIGLYRNFITSKNHSICSIRGYEVPSLLDHCSWFISGQQRLSASSVDPSGLYITGVLDHVWISQKIAIFISKSNNWSSCCQYQQKLQDLSELSRPADSHLEWSQKKIKLLHVPCDQNIPPYLSSIHQWKWFRWEEIPSGPKHHPQKTWHLLLEFIRSTQNHPAKIHRQGFHVWTVLRGWGNKGRTAEPQ